MRMIQVGLVLCASLAISVNAVGQLESAISNCGDNNLLRIERVEMAELWDLVSSTELKSEREIKIQNQKIEQAFQTLDLNPFECAILYQVMGANYYELGDLKNSILSFDQAIASGGLSESEEAKLLKNLDHLFAEHDPQKIHNQSEFICNWPLGKELCFIKIKAAYDIEVFTGKWELDDHKCLQYKADYDRLYRKHG